MIVCVCRRVSDRDIQRAAREGCGSFEDLQIDLGVAVCCGRCSDCARSVLAEAQQQVLPACACAPLAGAGRMAA